MNVFGVGVATCVGDYLTIEKMENTFVAKENLWERLSSLIVIPRHLTTKGLWRNSRFSKNLAAYLARTASIAGTLAAS